MAPNAYDLTFDQAADLLTAASIRDALNGCGGVPLTDAMREQHREQLAKVEARIPPRPPQHRMDGRRRP